MSTSKRAFDIVVAVVLIVTLLPVIAIVAGLILVVDGAPVFYGGERMKTPDRGFLLYKFRTMNTVLNDSGVSGSDKRARITRTGGFLRATRLDEVPQLLNVLKGDISFVGPRPPLRQYVERFPDIYGEVLLSRPGITGLASLYFHAREEALLSKCRSADETDAVYARVCIPRKARLDLIYQRNRSLCYDLYLMVKTAIAVLK